MCPDVSTQLGTSIWLSTEGGPRLNRTPSGDMAMGQPMRSSRGKASPILTSLVCGFLMCLGHEGENCWEEVLVRNVTMLQIGDGHTLPYIVGYIIIDKYL